MGLALFTLGGILAPLQGLVAGLLPGHGNARTARPVCAKATSIASAAHAPRVVRAPRAAPRSRQPLRIVRIVEPSRSVTGAGRMRISGRMADVCAELDRLAALEAAAH